MITWQFELSSLRIYLTFPAIILNSKNFGMQNEAWLFIDFYLIIFIF